MDGTPGGDSLHVLDRSQAALAFAQRLLSLRADGDIGLEVVARELGAAFDCPVVGIAEAQSGQPSIVYHADSDAVRDPLPWETDLDLLSSLLRSPDAITVADRSMNYLVAAMSPSRGGWLLWIGQPRPRDWTDAEKSALVLLAQLLVRRLTTGVVRGRFEKQLDRQVRQQCLEQAATLSRRLAHDFGNVLTGILGFSELAVAHPQPASAQLSRFIDEIYSCAQAGANLTYQLQLFSRRQKPSGRKGSLLTLLAEEEVRFGSPGGSKVNWQSSVPIDLPKVAMDQDPLRDVLRAVIDNAREAIVGQGTVTVSACTVLISEADCLDYFGNLLPGLHVEIRVSDSGPGLSEEAQRQLFVEPFFTTKARRRGFGLAVAYGLLSSNHGGFDLSQSPLGGVLARVLIPVVEEPLAAAVPAVKPVRIEKVFDEKVLVVDDDPMILQFVSLTLEQAGYRVKAVSNADDALDCYNAAGSDPFRLVLSDVVMPEVNGVDLARRLLIKDAQARILFMSGQVSPDFPRADFATHQFELLPKPFRPEGLLRAVRGALDRRSSDESRSHPPAAEAGSYLHP